MKQKSLSIMRVIVILSGLGLVLFLGEALCQESESSKNNIEVEQQEEASPVEPQADKKPTETKFILSPPQPLLEVS